jgi:hypothetical protein
MKAVLAFKPGLPFHCHVHLPFIADYIILYNQGKSLHILKKISNFFAEALCHPFTYLQFSREKATILLSCGQKDSRQKLKEKQKE